MNIQVQRDTENSEEVIWKTQYTTGVHISTVIKSFRSSNVTAWSVLDPQTENKNLLLK